MMKKALKEFCSSINIEYSGIAPIGPYYDLEEILRKREKLSHYTGFEESDMLLRIDPRLTMNNVKSIIVCLFPYFIGHIKDSNISKYTYAIDYHLTVKKRLEIIGMYLQEMIAGFEYKTFVDTGPLSDRYLAHKAGLGFWGINSHVINEKYGSYFFIGYILNNYPFEPDEPQDRTCFQCFRCVRKCPGQIILGNFDINPLGCRSYLTQKKGDLSEREEEVIRKTSMVFGCDVCQDVCPHNRNIETTPIEDFKSNLIYSLDYNELIDMSNKGFKRNYGDRAFSWRGRKIIMRNFDIINN